jgi:hypothetical protein
LNKSLSPSNSEKGTSGRRTRDEPGTLREENISHAFPEERKELVEEPGQKTEVEGDCEN